MKRDIYISQKAIDLRQWTISFFRKLPMLDCKLASRIAENARDSQRIREVR